MRHRIFQLVLLLLLIASLGLFLGANCGSKSSSSSSSDDDSGSGDDTAADDDSSATSCDDICAKMDECDQGSDTCVQDCKSQSDTAIGCIDKCLTSTDTCDMFSVCNKRCLSDGPPQDNLGTEVGKTMANWTLKDENGNDVSLYDYYGYVIMVDIMTGWCPSCSQEASELESYLYQPYKEKGFIILMGMIEDLNGNNPSETYMQGYIKSHGNFTFPLLNDYQAAKLGKYLVMDGSSFYIPQNIVLDRTMVIRDKIVGYDSGQVKNKVNTYVKDPYPF